MLNPDLDIEDLAARYRSEGKVRIHDLLKAEHAERIRAACARKVAFEYLFFEDGENYALSEAEMQALDPARRNSLNASIADAASRGIGFFYCGYKLGREDRSTIDADLGFLHDVFDFMNGPDMLGLVRAVCDSDELDSADAQYTRYTPGQFLTRHRDEHQRENRRVAYVYSLSKHWHPDWGGLLQFFADDGAPRDAWVPTFNALALFDVRHVHSVTYVTPFAREPRYSLTGWFRGSRAPGS